MLSQYLRVLFRLFVIVGLVCCSCCGCHERRNPTILTVPTPTPAPTRIEYAGFIWYLSPSWGLSCNDVCAAHGGCNNAGIVLAGSAGSDAALCNTLLDQFDIPAYSGTLWRWPVRDPDTEGAGCAQYYGDPVYYGRVIASPATCAANHLPSSQLPRRVCACNQ